MHGQHICDNRDLCQSIFAISAMDLFAIIANANVMNDLDQQNKRWLAQQLASLSHGERGKVAAEAGVTPTQLSRMANVDPEASPKNTQSIPIAKLRAFAEYFKDTPPGLASSKPLLAPTDEAEEKKSLLDVVQAPEFSDPRSRLGPATLPVLGITMGGRDDDRGPDFWMNGEVVNYVSRPRKLENHKGVFGIYVGGDSMEPRYRARDLVIVEKGMPAPGDDVVIELKSLNGDIDPENPSFLKQFVGRRGSFLTVRQFNPEKEIEFDLKEIKNLFRVIPLKELMG